MFAYGFGTIVMVVILMSTNEVLDCIVEDFNFLSDPTWLVDRCYRVSQGKPFGPCEVGGTWLQQVLIHPISHPHCSPLPQLHRC